MKRNFFGFVLVSIFIYNAGVFAAENNGVIAGAFQAEKENLAEKRHAAIVLVNPLMDIIDGANMGINANTYGLILKSRRDVRMRHYGRTVVDGQAAGTKIGYYDFNGSKKTLLEIVDIEKAAIATNDKNILEELQQLLGWAKEDFISITIEYLDSAKGMKDQLLIIIKEFHSKSGLGDFFLLDWGRTKDGGEIESIRKNVKSFNDLHILFTEMEGFLEALARSCKKGKKLFEKEIEKKKAEVK